MDHRKTLDRITNLETERKEAIKDLDTKDLTEEEVAGLAYRRGQVLKDKITGKEVKILAGKRASITFSGPGRGGS